MSAVMQAPTLSREEWLERRRSTITATDIAKILGLNPYGSAHDVYLDKKGLLPEVEENEPMWWGSQMEAKIGERYAFDKGVELIPGDFVTDPDEPFFGCTPDFLINPDSILECKVAGEGAARNFGDSETDQVPDHYLCQVMWQMAVTRTKVGRLAVLLPSLRMRTYTFHWDEQLIQHMRYQARKFWHEYVKSDNPPPLSGHKSDSEYLKSRFPKEEPESMIVADWNTDELATKLKVAIAKENEASLEVEEIKNHIKQFMGENAVLETTSGKFTWKTPAGGYTKWSQMIADLRTMAPEVSQLLDELKAKHTQPAERRFMTPFRSNKA